MYYAAKSKQQYSQYLMWLYFSSISSFDIDIGISITDTLACYSIWLPTLCCTDWSVVFCI